VTRFAPDDDDPFEAALERAERALQTGAGRAPLFFEDRTDVRVVAGPGDERDVNVTRSRGAAAGTRDSLHVTEPRLDDLVALARGEVAWAARWNEGVDQDPNPPLTDLDSGWISAAASSLGARADRAIHAMAEARWSATLVAFNQTIWVVTAESGIKRDVRSGCRVEFRVEMGRHPNSRAVEECVIGWGSESVPDGIVDRGVERADQRRDARPAPARGSHCVVLAPGAGGVVIHELVGHALEGDVVARRPTWIVRGALPQPERQLTIIDDPRRGRGAWRSDDEGEAASETILVTEGRATGILLDRGTAAALGRRSTGHGRRSSYLTATRPRMGCTFVAPGQDDPDDVLRETRDGLFVRRVSAGHTDPYLGRASFVVTDADEIIDGVIGAALEPFVIELDGREAWGSIDRVGHDLAFDTCVGSCVRDGQPLAVSVGAPTIRIGLMRVVS
jgi:predicted Zn-dependent protease